MCYESVTGAPGVAPAAGKPGLTIGIMGAPGAPGLHRDRGKEGKRHSKTQGPPSNECEGHLKGSSMSSNVQTGSGTLPDRMVVLPC